MICSYDIADDNKIKALQEAEKEVGTTLLAIKCEEYKPAALTKEQLERIQILEKELGLVVIAV